MRAAQAGLHANTLPAGPPRPPQGPPRPPTAPFSWLPPTCPIQGNYNPVVEKWGSEPTSACHGGHPKVTCTFLCLWEQSQAAQFQNRQDQRRGEKERLWETGRGRSVASGICPSHTERVQSYPAGRNEASDQAPGRVQTPARATWLQGRDRISQGNNNEDLPPDKIRRHRPSHLFISLYVWGRTDDCP